MTQYAHSRITLLDLIILGGSVFFILGGAVVAIDSFSNILEKPNISVFSHNTIKHYHATFHGAYSIDDIMPINQSMVESYELVIAFSANQSVDISVLNEKEFFFWSHNKSSNFQYSPILSASNGNLTYTPLDHNQTHHYVLFIEKNSKSTNLNVSISRIARLYLFEFPNQDREIQKVLGGMVIFIIGLGIGYYGFAEKWFVDIKEKIQKPIIQIKEPWLKGYLEAKRRSYHEDRKLGSRASMILVTTIIVAVGSIVVSSFAINNYFTDEFYRTVYQPVIIDFLFRLFIAAMLILPVTLFSTLSITDVFFKLADDSRLYLGLKLGYYTHFSSSLEQKHIDLHGKYLRRGLGILFISIFFSVIFYGLVIQSNIATPFFLWFFTFAIIIIALLFSLVNVKVLRELSKLNGVTKRMISEKSNRLSLELFGGSVVLFTGLLLSIRIILFSIDLIMPQVVESSVFFQYFIVSSFHSILLEEIPALNFLSVWVTGVLVISVYLLIFKALPALLDNPLLLLIRIITIVSIVFGVPRLQIIEEIVAIEFGNPLFGYFIFGLFGWLVSEVTVKITEKMAPKILSFIKAGRHQ